MKIKKVEETYLMKFKNQVKISKMFGKEAIKVYNAIPKDNWIDEEELAKITGMDKSTVIKIMEFMEKEGMVITPEKEVVEEKVVEKVKEMPTKVLEKGIEPKKVVEEKEIKEEFEIKPEIEEIKPEEVREMRKTEEIEEIKTEEAKKEEKIELERETKEEELGFEEEIKPEFEVGTVEKVEEEEIEEKPQLSLSDEEKQIYDAFGESGIEVYKKLKEGKTPREIAISLGMNEGDVNEIKDFLINKGLIEQEVVEEEEKYAPLTGKEEEAVVIKEEDAVKLVKLKNLSFVDKIKDKFSIVMKFKKQGRIIFETLEKEKEITNVELVEKLNIPINTVESVINELKKMNIVETRTLDRDEIRKLFGYDSLAVYKKFGKNGIIMYDLVGKDLPLKEIAKLSSITDKEKVFEIFLFIHKLLGIEIPIDKSLIMKQLE